MRFYKYLIEKEMPISQALAIFGLNNKALGNKALLKKRYRDLATKYHPDKLGGDTEKMTNINLAWEVLKKSKPLSIEFPDYETAKMSSKAKANLYKDLYKSGMFGGSKLKGVYA